MLIEIKKEILESLKIHHAWEMFERLALIHTEGFFMDDWGNQGVSYFGFEPIESISHVVKDPENPILQEELRRLIQKSKHGARTDHYPFEGGVVAMIGYNCGAEFESFPKRKKHQESQEDFCLALYDEIFIYDHNKHQFFLSIPGSDIDKFDNNQQSSWVDKKIKGLESSLVKSRSIQISKFKSKNLHLKESREAYSKWVRQTVEYIAAGDIFQANLAHPLGFEFEGSPFELYGRMRQHNPSPYGGVYFKSKMCLLSNSPELLFSNISGKIVTRPIAGTRPRSDKSQEDLANKTELFLSEKEQAEHIMLVDLERNDLGRVSKMGTVEVEELMVCETYQNVFHIVSQVVGQLKSGNDSVDVLRALFPGGTITGAPKIRSMEIIDEFENHDRLYYTGALGWFNQTGDAVLNILIRSLNLTLTPEGQGHGRLHVGAGIVADSDPNREFEETLAKASAWMNFLGSLTEHDST